MGTITITINSFEEFVDAIFANAVAPVRGAPWYWREEVDFEITLEACAEYYVQLFESPEFLLEKFDYVQLENGFDSMWDINFGLSVNELIWDKQLSVETRERVIAAMVALYQKLFAIRSLGYATYMWWDAMVADYRFSNADRKLSEEERRIQEAIFAALRKILMIPSEDCQEAALHGLGHLQHPETRSLIQEYLAAYPSLPEYKREEALRTLEDEGW